MRIKWNQVLLSTNNNQSTLGFPGADYFVYRLIMVSQNEVQNTVQGSELKVHV